MNRRWGVVVSAGALGLAVLAGCGATDGAEAGSTSGTSADAGSTGGTAGGTADEQALAEVGLVYQDGSVSTTDVSDGTPSASASPSGSASAEPQHRRGHHRRLRRYVRRHTLHGDITVTTKKGVVTVAVQRGTVTAVSATSMTVKSSDGFTQTWALTKNTAVRANRQKADTSAIRTGEQIGVAGRKSGDTDTARLVFIVPEK